MSRYPEHHPHSIVEEAFLPAEEVAERLGLPLGVLLGRLEAGDVPARRTIDPHGVRYSVRLSDLGIEQDDEVPAAVLSADPAAPLADAVDAEVATSADTGGDDPGGDPGFALIGESLRAPGPRSEVATMTLDAREVVAGLLDRWEHTLEQRIHSELRPRFEAEIMARKNRERELQMELRATRAEHAAAHSEKERLLAEKERALADLEREVSQLRASPPRRRVWPFFR